MNKDHLNEELISIKFFQSIGGLGPVRFRKIFEEFKSFRAFLDHIENLKGFSSPEIIKILGKNIFLKLRKKIIDPNYLSNSAEFIYKQINLCKKNDGKIITYWEPNYPQRLYKTNQSIPILYSIGDIGLLNFEKLCAVVGTRQPCNWTIMETINLVKKYVSENYVIISGLAKGIDAVAHNSALNNNGKTISVTGNGPDVYYPKENTDIQDKIKKYGLIISEYPFGSKITPLSLQKRNKLIVGLSDFVFITETSITGGTMNSYLAAVEQKRSLKIFLPISDVGGDFSGNLKIFKNKLINVEKYANINEPELKTLKNIKIILFDLDGTLWDSYDAIKDTMINILINKSIKLKEIENNIIKYKSPNALFNYYGLENINQYWKLYNDNLYKIKLYDNNINNIFKEIKNNKNIGIVTNFKGDIAKKLLIKFNLIKYVDVFVSPSETRSRKPSPTPINIALKKMKLKPKDAIYIGDDDLDILSAKNADCYSGLAAWNKYNEITQKPNYIFSNLNEILKYLGE